MDQTPKDSESGQVTRAQIRSQLDQLEANINDLKVQFEQYFAGLNKFPPDKLHAQVKREIRRLLAAPFKNSELSFRLRALEGRYRTYHTYWERVQKQREAGAYSKDVFKADLRVRHAKEDQHAQTAEGKVERGMHDLFSSYKSALEKESGMKQNIDFKAFQRSLVSRARELKAKHAGKKISFKVVVQDGKVSLQARVKK
ncbi:MAG: hypothetical protein K1X79_10420 [Oligoflexia bacterium]|nr:hypothetical protein [Oligoflexia bacterium]